jgi:prepilin-type processing-associated H-X9-DG protein
MSKREWFVLLLMAALLLSIGLPYVQVTRDHARRNTCDKTMAELAQALFRAHELQNALPGYREGEPLAKQEPLPCVAWPFVLLPYLGLSATEQELIDKQFSTARFGPYQSLQADWLAGKKSQSAQELRLKPLCCPAIAPQQERPARIQFVANCGLPDAPASREFPADWPANGLFQDRWLNPQQPTKIAEPLSLEMVEARDGRAHTLLFAENSDAGDWTETDEARIGFLWLATEHEGKLMRDNSLWGINEHRGAGDGSIAFARPASVHRGGVNVVFGDGRTQFLDPRIDDEIFMRWMTVDDEQLRLPGQDELFPVEFRREPIPVEASE